MYHFPILKGEPHLTIGEMSVQLMKYLIEIYQIVLDEALMETRNSFDSHHLLELLATLEEMQQGMHIEKNHL